MAIIFKFITAAVLFLAMTSQSVANDLPSPEDMEQLLPVAPQRLQMFDRFFPSSAQASREAHARYSDPAVLQDVEQRLARVRLSGLAEDIFSAEERRQFEINMVVLRGLEAQFFDRWYLKLPMSWAIRMQTWFTRTRSPVPRGAQYDVVLNQIQWAARENRLYSQWHQSLPLQWQTSEGPATWGQLLVKFNTDEACR